MDTLFAKPSIKIPVELRHTQPIKPSFNPAKFMSICNPKSTMGFGSGCVLLKTSTGSFHTDLNHSHKRNICSRVSTCAWHIGHNGSGIFFSKDYPSNLRRKMANELRVPEIEKTRKYLGIPSYWGVSKQQISA
ncbi:uncharacterized protein LOC104426745 isoform X1 [Eucalyptus grandis]|uniref:uncharacterized protein LOC104426745 isoform X1 n=1 Tax=Eucalyptus grandis TaxID=71139 RepID=UPI00192EEC0F|nr:uncharacterized protein LOC104426745 isoform X1 [Eucalyptus grandis]